MYRQPGCAKATLLPLRCEGPPTDIGAALEALHQQRPPLMLVPNLPSIAEQLGGFSNTVPAATAAAGGEPILCPDRRVSYGGFLDSEPPERRRSPPQRCKAAPIRSAGNPSVRASRDRARGEAQENVVSSSERARYRNSIVRKLLDLYEEVREMHVSSGNMSRQLVKAMRGDPRYAKERFGEVMLRTAPTSTQSTALASLVESMAALHDAVVEMVATFLAPEEKRHMGLDTHRFQTRDERATTYQYVDGTRGAQRGDKGPPTRESRRGARSQHDAPSTTATVASAGAAAASLDGESRRSKLCKNQSATPSHTTRRNASRAMGRASACSATRPQPQSPPRTPLPAAPAERVTSPPCTRLERPLGGAEPEGTPERVIAQDRCLSSLNGGESSIESSPQRSPVQSREAVHTSSATEQTPQQPKPTAPPRAIGTDLGVGQAPLKMTRAAIKRFIIDSTDSESNRS